MCESRFFLPVWMDSPFVTGEELRELFVVRDHSMDVLLETGRLDFHRSVFIR